MDTAEPVKPRGPCVHLEADTGERVACKSCGESKAGKAKTLTFVFACEIHGRCTLARDGGMACCATCKDFRERDGA